MKDPYILENGTLKNLLNITDEKELKKAERDIGFAKLMDIGELSNEKCDVELLKKFINIYLKIYLTGQENLELFL